MINVSHYGKIMRLELARTLLGRGRYWTVAYLVDGLLIDSGCAFTAPELFKSVQGIPLNLIANSHTHEDHIGGNALLQQQNPALQIMAHPLALAVLEHPQREQPLHPYRRLFWGWPKPCLAEALTDGQIIETNNYQFEVIYTPGHSNDHLCLFEPQQGWLFTGDLFVGGQDRALRQGCDIWEMITSLKKLSELPVKTLFPGSARVREEAVNELRSKIAYYESFGVRVLELKKKGWSVSKIVHELCGGPRWIELLTLGHFSPHHLVNSYLGMYSPLTSSIKT